MEPIAGSYRIRCRMFSSCLTCPIVPPSYSVRRLAVSSSFRRSLPLLACLTLSCSLARLVSLLVSLLVERDGSAMGVGSVCDCGGRGDVVLMSCGCHAVAACSSVRLRTACVHRPAPSTRVAGRGAGRCRCLLLSVPYCLPRSLACEAGGSCLLACSYGRRSFPSCDMRVRGFCGSHSWRLPGLLRHDILMSCRRGRMSAIAVHRDSLACFSIPIFLSAL